MDLLINTLPNNSTRYYIDSDKPDLLRLILWRKSQNACLIKICNKRTLNIKEIPRCYYSNSFLNSKVYFTLYNNLYISSNKKKIRPCLSQRISYFCPDSPSKTSHGIYCKSRLIKLGCSIGLGFVRFYEKVNHSRRCRTLTELLYDINKNNRFYLYFFLRFH